MIKRKNYNNLYDSILLTILLVFMVAFYCIILYWGVINAKEGTNTVALFVFDTLLFGFFSIVLIILIIKYCYECWIIEDDSILSKKLFRRKLTIYYKEVLKVEKKVVPAIILSTYKSDAYIIASNYSIITILINKSNEEFLKEIFNNYLNK